jgi:hypothetical protein
MVTFDSSFGITAAQTTRSNMDSWYRSFEMHTHLKAKEHGVQVLNIGGKAEDARTCHFASLLFLHPGLAPAACAL